MTRAIRNIALGLLSPFVVVAFAILVLPAGILMGLGDRLARELGLEHDQDD